MSQRVARSTSPKQKKAGAENLKKAREVRLRNLKKVAHVEGDDPYTLIHYYQHPTTGKLFKTTGPMSGYKQDTRGYHHKDPRPVSDTRHLAGLYRDYFAPHEERGSYHESGSNTVTPAGRKSRSFKRQVSKAFKSEISREKKLQEEQAKKDSERLSVPLKARKKFEEYQEWMKANEEGLTGGDYGARYSRLRKKEGRFHASIRRMGGGKLLDTRLRGYYFICWGRP